MNKDKQFVLDRKEFGSIAYVEVAMTIQVGSKQIPYVARSARLLILYKKRTVVQPVYVYQEIQSLKPPVKLKRICGWIVCRDSLEIYDRQRDLS